MWFIPVIGVAAAGLTWLIDSSAKAWGGNQPQEPPATVSTLTLVLWIVGGVVALAFIKQLKGLFK